VNKASLNRFYDVASDFNDSLSLIGILLIIHKKTDLDFVDIKHKLAELECDDEMIDHIEDLSLSIPSEDMGRLIRLIAPIDKLFARDKPRDIPNIITIGREQFKGKKKKQRTRKPIKQCKCYATLF